MMYLLLTVVAFAVAGCAALVLLVDAAEARITRIDVEVASDEFLVTLQRQSGAVERYRGRDAEWRNLDGVRCGPSTAQCLRDASQGVK